MHLAALPNFFFLCGITLLHLLERDDILVNYRFPTFRRDVVSSFSMIYRSEKISVISVSFNTKTARLFQTPRPRVPSEAASYSRRTESSTIGRVKPQDSHPYISNTSVHSVTNITLVIPFCLTLPYNQRKYLSRLSAMGTLPVTI